MKQFTRIIFNTGIRSIGADSTDFIGSAGADQIAGSVPTFVLNSARL